MYFGETTPAFSSLPIVLLSPLIPIAAIPSTGRIVASLSAFLKIGPIFRPKLITLNRKPTFGLLVMGAS